MCIVRGVKLDESSSSTTLSSICFNINGLMLSPTPRSSGDLLGSSTAGMTAGEALGAAGSSCKFSLEAMPWWSVVRTGSPELPPRAPSIAMFRQPHVPPRNVRHSSDPWEEKSNLLFWRGKKLWIWNEGSWPVPPRATTTGMGRERELRERDSSHKHSRNYFWKLRERTPLHFLTERYRNWISRYLDVSPLWCRHFQYLGFLKGAPTTNFARKRVKTRYLTLFRTTRNSVVICRVSLLYEMSYSFHSTVLVPTEF